MIYSTEIERNSLGLQNCSCLRSRY